ncbi:Zinc knuckle CX2CX4HX4C [Trema orientale]|uniref:Zinc knuckle CX2CX4HX4C n=1 Tax=Trema orientale TaxID=63057 RepID=A0A2P5F541_TREOI|nr:Zinc knuckle CX2CX4HX4C [Trema orientale]
MASVDVIETLVHQTEALHCADDPLELIPSDLPTRIATRSKLVGKLFRTKKLGRNVVKGVLQRAWEREHAWSIAEEKPNLFIFTFTKEEDRKFARDQGPWTVNGSLLVIKEWPPQTPLSEVKFESADLWIRVHGLPLCYFSEDNAKRIGQRAGSVINVMVPKPRSNLWGRSLRIQVEVNLLRPLVAGFFLKNEFGTPQWIQLKYERLCKFCHHCGLVDHEENSCVSRTPVMVADSSGRRVRLYGHWVCGASPVISCFNLNLIHKEPFHGPMPHQQPRRKPSQSAIAPAVPVQTKLIDSNLTGDHFPTLSMAEAGGHVDEFNGLERSNCSNRGHHTQRVSASACLVGGSVNVTTTVGRSAIDNQVLAEAQANMKEQRKLKRGGNVFVLQAKASEFNEQLDFLLIPSPPRHFQPIQAALIPPTGLCELGSGPKRKAQPFVIPKINYGKWVVTESRDSPSDVDNSCGPNRPGVDLSPKDLVFATGTSSSPICGGRKKRRITHLA